MSSCDTFILGPEILIQELLVCEPQKEHVCYVEHAKALCFDSWDITSSVLSSYSLDSYSKTAMFSCSASLHLLICVTCVHVTFSILIGLLYCTEIVVFQAKFCPYREIVFPSLQKNTSFYPLPPLTVECVHHLYCGNHSLEQSVAYLLLFVTTFS